MIDSLNKRLAAPPPPPLTPPPLALRLHAPATTGQTHRLGAPPPPGGARVTPLADNPAHHIHHATLLTP